MSIENISELKEKYLENGVVRIPKVFSVDEMNKARASAFMAIAKEGEVTKNGYKHNVLETVDNDGVKFPGLMFWPSLADEHLDSLKSDPRLVGVVRGFLGDNVKQLNNQLYYRLAGDSDHFNWHQDIMFRSPRSKYPGIVENNSYLQTAILIDTIDETNAPIMFAKGSPKLGDIQLLPDNYEGLRDYPDKDNTEKFKDYPLEYCMGESGDVLVWSALTVHGSYKNESQKSRMYYMNGFAKSENCEPWPNYLVNGEVVPTDASLIP